MSDPFDGQCMLTAVLRRCSSVRLSTAVQGDIASTMHGLAMSIAAAHQYACAVSVQTCGGGYPVRILNYPLRILINNTTSPGS